MIGLLISLAATLPQGPDVKSEVMLLTGAVQEGRLSLGQLHLGNGGLGDKRVNLQHAEQGRILSPGGVLIRVKRQGVKLDFPSGSELLISPRGRIHLRGGESTAPAMASGLELVLADDSRLRVYPSVSSRGQFRAEFLVEGRRITLWDRVKRIVEAGHKPDFRGRTLLVLGDGRSLYSPVWLGPILVLEQALCPLQLQGRMPNKRVMLIGELLAKSLLALKHTIPRKTVEFPQAPEAVSTLARMVPQLFPEGALRELFANDGTMQIALFNSFRIRVTVGESQTVFIRLLRGSSRVPVVEWTISSRTRLQLVRPGGGEVTGPRYYLRGVELEQPMNSLLETNQNFRDLTRARGILEELGARELGKALRAKK